LPGVDGDDGDVRRLVAQPLGERVEELGLADPGQPVEVERERPVAGGEPGEPGDLGLAADEGLARASLQPVAEPCHASRIARSFPQPPDQSPSLMTLGMLVEGRFGSTTETRTPPAAKAARSAAPVRQMDNVPWPSATPRVGSR